MVAIEGDEAIVRDVLAAVAPSATAQ
jgi:hypothetical protein